MKKALPAEWRTDVKWKRWFYSRYMRWLERLGYVLLIGVVAALGYAFTYKVDETITADGVEVRRDAATGEVYVEASLKGEAVPSAKVGQTARLTAVTIEAMSGTLLRATDGKSEWISGTALGDSVKAVLEKRLAGSQLSSRVDPALIVKSVSEVAVDASVTATASDGPGQVLLEPAATAVLAGKVVCGTHLATVQVSTLPKEVQTELTDAVRGSLVGKQLTTSEGKVVSAEALTSAHFVVKVKAEPVEGSGAKLAAAPVNREFKAKVEVTVPPPYLIDALKAGRKVTCRVELATRQKPIALTLLKKS